MISSAFGMRRGLALAAVVFILAGIFAAIPASAEPGVPPDITSISSPDQDIDPGETRTYNVAVTGYDTGGTWTFSGTGLTVTQVRLKANGVRLTITADATAEAGLRSLTVVNPDGLSDTYPNAITVTGDIPPPASGDLAGHVFDDADGDGVADPGELGLAGVSVTVTDADGNSHTMSTDGNGDYVITALPVGSATAAYGTPSGYALTTGNASQTVTISDGVTTSAAAVGYQAVPNGDISGHVFSDTDGDGVEDAGEVGLADVSVTIVDSAGGISNATTSGTGDWTIAGLPVGDADVTYTTPAGFTLTTGNDMQTVAITDGGTATAAAVGYEPPAGTAPVVIGFTDADKDIDQGEVRNGRLEVLNYQTGGTVTFSGSGLTATVSSVKGDVLRLRITATDTAESGWRTVTVTNPDGLSGSLGDAFYVNPGVPVATGDVTGHVFADLDGNGVEDGSDTPLAGVSVSFLDAGGTSWPGTTDASGNFTLTVGVGDGTLTVTTPVGNALTTGNATQVLNVTDGGSTAAAPVGYAPGGTNFTNVAGAAGLTLSHSGDYCGAPIGIGGAWGDVDNDGDQDLYTTDAAGHNNHMYINQGDTSGDGVVDFVDQASSLGIAMSSFDSWATLFFDFDNDGDQDLFVADSSGNHMWKNMLVENGSLSFTDVSASAGVTDLGRVETATAGDFDNDGYLDLYLAKHMHCAGTTQDRLFHNDGDGTFTDWTTYLCGGGDPATCDDVLGLGFAAGFFDYDNDGDQDLYLVNDNISGVNQPNKMWRNDGSDGSGGWNFVEVGATNGSGLSVNGMGLGIGDYNNDGFTDIAFSDAKPGHLVMNNGNGTFTDVSGSSGVTAETAGAIGWGTAFFDWNNNGWTDLFFAHGYIGDLDPMANALLDNNGNGTFTNVSAATGMDDMSRGRAVSIADMNNDGWVDVFVGNMTQAPILMQNNSGALGYTEGWLTVTVEGTESNRDGIGTEMVLTTSAGSQRQVITSGFNHGGGSQKAAFYGLGADATASLTVYWPNGQVQTFSSVSANQVLHLVEPTTPGTSGGTFVDVASAVGITYTHVIDECGGPMGVGAAWADVDNDGDQDLYTTNQIGPNHMYINQGDTTGDGVPDFVDMAVSLGLDASATSSYAAVFADVDNDGDQDLYYSSKAGNKLFRNEFANNGGTLAFTDMSAQAGLTDAGKVQTATFGDIDNDGILDLYLAKHMSCSGDNIDRLYHGNGNGTFTDWTSYLCGGTTTDCSTTNGLGFAAGIADFDRDGDNDIYLVNDNIQFVNQPNKMIRNDGSDGAGGWIFTEVGAATGTDSSVNGMGLGMGDYDNDGWIDLAFSDAAPGHLLSNDGDGTYTNVSTSSGVQGGTAGKIGWGTAFMDYDNDGWQDLFFVNGGIGTDAPYGNSLLGNNGNGTFTNVSASAGMDDTGRGRSLAMADFDGDGWIDVFVGNFGQAPILMRNQSAAGGNTNNHLVITVEGTDSNRDGIGTELRLTTAEGVEYQLISSGSNHGGGSQKAAFFGLGAATSGTLTVTWPNGVVQNLGTVSAGTMHLVEPAA